MPTSLLQIFSLWSSVDTNRSRMTKYRASNGSELDEARRDRIWGWDNDVRNCASTAKSIMPLLCFIQVLLQTWKLLWIYQVILHYFKIIPIHLIQLRISNSEFRTPNSSPWRFTICWARRWLPCFLLPCLPVLTRWSGTLPDCPAGCISTGWRRTVLCRRGRWF